MRNLFLLDAAITLLNHGSFGACPREVLDAQRHWQLEMERNPVEFLGRRSAEPLFHARGALGRQLGARAEELLFAQLHDRRQRRCAVVSALGRR